MLLLSCIALYRSGGMEPTTAPPADDTTTPMHPTHKNANNSRTDATVVEDLCEDVGEDENAPGRTSVCSKLLRLFYDPQKGNNSKP